VGRISVWLQWSLGQNNSLKKEKMIQSHTTKNVPGVFGVYSSEETNLQESEHKVMDGKTLLNGGSHA